MIPLAASTQDTQTTANALRAVFRNADRTVRQQLVPILPPQEIEFAGIRMYVDPRDNYTDRMLWLNEQPPELQSLMALTEMVEGKNAFVMDIGANCGSFTVPLGLATGEGSRVVAFEPNPVMVGRLGHNIALNGLGGKVRIENCALGAVQDEAILNLKHGNYGQASLSPIRDKMRAGGTLVPVRPVTDFVGQAKYHDLSVIKIDIEGAEVAALAPLFEADAWVPDAILMETRHAAEWDVDLGKKLVSMGFKVTLEAEGNTLFVR